MSQVPPPVPPPAGAEPPPVAAPQTQKKPPTPALIALAVVVGFCFIIMIFGALIGDDDSAGTQDEVTLESGENGEAVNAAPVVEQVDPKVEYMAMIDRELESLSSYKTDFGQDVAVVEVIIQAAVFNVWAGMINNAQNHDLSDEELAKVRKMAKDVKRVQRRDFPKIRKAYGDALDRKLWENDIDVKVRGSRSTTIEVVGALFAANRNIQDFQTQVRQDWKALRFKRSQYKWFDLADEYQYYDFEGANDDDLLSFEDEGLVKVEIP